MYYYSKKLYMTDSYIVFLSFVSPFLSPYSYTGLNTHRQCLSNANFKLMNCN